MIYCLLCNGFICDFPIPSWISDMEDDCNYHRLCIDIMLSHGVTTWQEREGGDALIDDTAPPSSFALELALAKPTGNCSFILGLPRNIWLLILSTVSMRDFLGSFAIASKAVLAQCRHPALWHDFLTHVNSPYPLQKTRNLYEAIRRTRGLKRRRRDFSRHNQFIMHDNVLLDRLDCDTFDGITHLILGTVIVTASGSSTFKSLTSLLYLQARFHRERGGNRHCFLVELPTSLLRAYILCGEGILIVPSDESCFHPSVQIVLEE